MGLEQAGEAAHKVVDVRHMGQHVVGGDQVGLAASAGQFVGQSHAKKALHHLQAQRPRRLGGAGRRLYAVAGNASLLHVLQQVAVVRRDLDHAAACAQAQALLHGLHIGFGMGEPGRRERAEVGVVVREQRLTPGVVFGLYQPAVRAHQHAQGEPNLGRAQGGLAQVGVGRRSAAQVQKRQVQRLAAVSALHRCTPSNDAVSSAWLRSRSDISPTGSGQGSAKRGSSGFRPASAPGA